MLFNLNFLLSVVFFRIIYFLSAHCGGPLSIPSGLFWTFPVEELSMGSVCQWV